MIGAALAGFALVVAVVMAVEVVLMQVSPASFTRPDGSWRLPEPLAPWYAANLGYSFVAAVSGARVTLGLAGPHAKPSVWVLLLLLVASNVATLLGPTSEGLEIPTCWTFGELVVGLLGVGTAWKWSRS